MHLSLGLVTAMTIRKSIALAKAAEDVGYHRIWAGEDIFHREIFTYLSVLALNTKSIGLGTGITSTYVRNLPVLANSSKALSELSSDRFILGLGVGGLPEVEKLTGARPKNVVKTLEETALLLKEKRGIKIYMGVRGPRMLELAGRVADGVILSGPRGYIEKAIEIVDGASNGRRVEKVLWNAFYLGENPRLVSKITSVMMESMPTFARRYMDPAGAEDELCITGSLEHVKEEITGYEKQGIDELVIGPPYGENPIEVIKEMEVR
ncbi:MAG TPA: LLM class flavin-dependent oxidoreductase [Euryarchaeota archaeon]|nr:methylenetetrahydromethanopterin reductase [archaeon BMS3Bbin16]HDH28951.1 LLM class flavin-dependent oxidoreductase [Euryarchaeota archaeon]